MKIITVKRSEIPAGWTDEHVRALEHGHERTVLSSTLDKRKKIAEAPVDEFESTPDPDGDLAEERFTRYDSSEAFIASLEQRS